MEYGSSSTLDFLKFTISWQQETAPRKVLLQTWIQPLNFTRLILRSVYYLRDFRLCFNFRFCFNYLKSFETVCSLCSVASSFKWQPSGSHWAIWSVFIHAGMLAGKYWLQTCIQMAALLSPLSLLSSFADKFHIVTEWFTHGFVNLVRSPVAALKFATVPVKFWPIQSWGFSRGSREAAVYV